MKASVKKQIQALTVIETIRLVRMAAQQAKLANAEMAVNMLNNAADISPETTASLADLLSAIKGEDKVKLKNTG